MTKSEITKKLKELEKLGIKVFTFNYNRKMPSGLRGMPDYLLVLREGRIIFIEVKLKGDKFRIEQEEFKNFCISKDIDYYVINDNNINEIIDTIIKRINYE